MRLHSSAQVARGNMESHGCPGYYRAVSLHLSRALDEVGLNKLTVKKRRQARLFKEQMHNLYYRLNEEDIITYHFGSQTEGATTPAMDSDIDTLHCLNDGNVIEDWVDWKKGEQNLLMLHEDTAPGYCRLQVLRSDVPMPSRYDLPSEIYTYDSNDRVILKNTIIHSVFKGGEERSGPAVATSDGPGFIDADYVYALPYSRWPAQAADFTRRRRHHGWPSQRLIEEATSHGVFLVPVGYKLSPTEPLEWRISASMAERCLMFSLTIVHIKCYTVLKILVKTFIGPHIQKCISSYHCKTALLHCMETTEPGFWREDNLLHCITRCLQILQNWVSALFCPQFMISGENLFAGKVTVRNRDLLLSILTELIRCDGRALLQVKMDDLGHKLQARLSTEPSRVPIVDSLASVELVGTFERDNHETVSWFMAMYIIRDEGTHQVSLMQSLYQKINTLKGEIRRVNIHERKATNAFITILSCWLGSLLASFALSHNMRVPRQAIQLMSTEADYDVASMLKLASAFYCSGQLRIVADVLQAVELHYDSNDMLVVCECYTRPSNLPNEFCHMMYMMRGKKARAKLFSHCVRFSRHEIRCAPSALRHEMYKSGGDDIQHRDPVQDIWMVLAAVDCLPFLYYLQYLTYTQLGKHGLQRRSLRNLDRCVREDHDFGHFETAWNLLGQCLENEQDIIGAMVCYRVSLEIRPTNNAAKWHVAILWYKMVKLYGLLPGFARNQTGK